MNANSLPKTPTYDDWLLRASSQFKKAGITSARLDAELILAHTIRKPRTYLHSHGNELLDERREGIADARLELRLNRTPIAYIVGHKEFYGRQFKTTPVALVPRAESETIIDILKEILPPNLSLLPKHPRLIDVGTGTGCLGITAKLELPELDITLTDISTHALQLAKENAKQLQADVHFLKLNLLRGYTAPIDILIVNLPYVDKYWDVSPDTAAEPKEALYAAEGGLALIYQLIEQAAILMTVGGYLILESDPRQHDAINAHAKKFGFRHSQTRGYISVFTKSN